MVRKTDYIFNWDNIEQSESGKKNLRKFLIDELNIDWVDSADIKKIDNGMSIEISKEEDSAKITIDKKAVLRFNDGRTYSLLAKEENGNINIYRETDGIGNSHMGLTGILLIAIYIIGLSLVLLAGIILILPTVTTGTDFKTVSILGFDLSIEARLVLIVALSGALGGLVHSLRSFYWYLGNRELVWSWVGMYLLMPFVGTTLGVVFYLIVRGGFFSPQSTVQQTSPFGFAAMAALVGLFSEQAVLKLQKVAETVLTEASEGKNSKPQGTQKKR